MAGRSIGGRTPGPLVLLGPELVRGQCLSAASSTGLVLAEVLDVVEVDPLDLLYFALEVRGLVLIPLSFLSLQPFEVLALLAERQ